MPENAKSGVFFENSTFGGMGAQITEIPICAQITEIPIYELYWFILIIKIIIKINQY